jgi:hypothetical protein
VIIEANRQTEVRNRKEWWLVEGPEEEETEKKEPLAPEA